MWTALVLWIFLLACSQKWLKVLEKYLRLFNHKGWYYSRSQGDDRSSSLNILNSCFLIPGKNNPNSKSFLPKTVVCILASCCSFLLDTGSEEHLKWLEVRSHQTLPPWGWVGSSGSLTSSRQLWGTSRERVQSCRWASEKSLAGGFFFFFKLIKTAHYTEC